MLKQYFADIYKTYKSREATESSYYPDLKKLLVSFLKSKGIDPTVTVQPKKTEAGIPDFTARREGMQLIGYVEAKDIGVNLDQLEDTDQIKRYKENLPNFIFTNYFDFWLWRRDGLDEKKGQWIKKIRIAMPSDLKLNVAPIPQTQKEKEFFELLDAFFSFIISERRTAKSLAKELADRAKLIHPEIVYLLNDEKEEEIDRIYNAFKEYLISDLKKEDFSDIYAQTITYGLFTARLQYKNGRDFDRFKAQRYIPQNIKILKDTFSLISSQELPEAITPYVDDIATVLAYADIEKIREDLHLKRGDDDPLIHFYETFLAEYSPETRRARGVYYTPLPVVSYITRSINILLKEKFGKKEGFASEGVTLLDPAAGTLTFPASAIRLAKEEIEKSDIAGSWNKIIQNHILKDFYAFELLMAPYIIGHLKISLLLEDFGYKLTEKDRIQLYLTNTLDLKDYKKESMPFVSGLSEEAIEAKRIKDEQEILVVMGNPPYSVSSSNVVEKPKPDDEGKAPIDLFSVYESYKETVRKQERNIQPLSDDYIKFIAFAHWKIKQTGQGIVGMITNNSYLDGLIHRDMRRRLLEDFNEIYILNLHGSLRRARDKDENVFDIQQGVSIILLVKDNSEKYKVKYFEIIGPREKKNDLLKASDTVNIGWQKLDPRAPNYFFIPRDSTGETTYEQFVSMGDIFIENTSGVKTHRDHLVVGFNDNEIKQRLNILRSELEDEIVAQNLNLKDTGSWNLQKARSLLRNEEIEDHLTSYAWRPFDIRRIYYSTRLVTRPRTEVMRHLLKENLALITTKILSGTTFNHVFLSKELGDICFISNKTKETNYYFPLYLYYFEDQSMPGQSQLDIRETQDQLRVRGDKEPNIRRDFFDALAKVYGKEPMPEEIFYYIYAVLYSNVYRKKYNEFLKIDFPRVPFTKDKKLFDQLSKLGEELVKFHLMKSDELEKSPTRFAGDGMNLVEKLQYKEKEKRVYINKGQYFEGVGLEVWNYYIGGYQVLEKWLKDRKGRYLSPEEVKHYLKIVATITQTIEIQKEIDKLYPKAEKDPIKFK